MSVITYERIAVSLATRVEGVEKDHAQAVSPAAIGARVKALRESSGLSLRDLAARSGVSAPMLSQVERGETSPTLNVAARIAAGLELRLSQLLRLDEGSSVTVVRKSQRQRGGNTSRGHRFEVLTATKGARETWGGSTTIV
jgi:transcriptional regulator with XRE-family HTH domain